MSQRCWRSKRYFPIVSHVQVDNETFLHSKRKSEGHDFFHISLVRGTQATQASEITTLSNTNIKPIVNSGKVGLESMWILSKYK